MICRLCHEPAWNEDLLKYGVRHFAHFPCWLEAGRPLSALPKAQIKRFPYRLLKEHGLIEEAERLIGGA